MSKPIQITREQYLTLLDLGVPVTCTSSLSEPYILENLLRDTQKFADMHVRRGWSDAYFTFWTLVDAE